MKKNNYIFLTAVMLLTLVLITSLLVSSIYAKYVGKEQSENSSKVATFNCNMTSDSTTISLSINQDPVTFDVEIVNYEGDNISEVLCEYGFEVVTLGNLPLKIEIQEKNFDGNGTMASINNLIVSGGVMSYDQKTKHVFTVSVQWDKSIANYNDAKYSEEIDLLKVVFTGTQVD